MEFKGVIVKIQYKKVLVLTEGFKFVFIRAKDSHAIGKNVEFNQNDIIEKKKLPIKTLTLILIISLGIFFKEELIEIFQNVIKNSKLKGAT
jgi:hypothetical protein